MSLIDLSGVASDVSDEELDLFLEENPDGSGTESSSSTSSASSQPASRSGTSSRSLRGLMRSKFLLDCCRILLATGAAQSQRHRGPGIASSDKDGTSTP